VRRGFRGCEPEARGRLEEVGKSFLRGYLAALEEDALEALILRLSATEADLRGFAYEGAAMGLALLDLLMPWSTNRLGSFLEGPGSAHAYMAHVGVGWALARLRKRVERPLSRLDPLLRLNHPRWFFSVVAPVSWG
jgi:hypothetical protein